MDCENEITAANLRNHRRRHKMTQVQVAALLGVEKTAVSAIETGVRQLAHTEKLILECYLIGRIPSLKEVLATA